MILYVYKQRKEKTMKKAIMILIISLLLGLSACTSTEPQISEESDDIKFIDVSGTFVATIDELLINKDTNEETLALVSFFQSGQALIDLSNVDLSDVKLGERYIFTTDEKTMETTFDEDDIDELQSPTVYLEVFGLRVIDITLDESVTMPEVSGLEIEFY